MMNNHAFFNSFLRIMMIRFEWVIDSYLDMYFGLILQETVEPIHYHATGLDKTWQECQPTAAGDLVLFHLVLFLSDPMLSFGVDWALLILIAASSWLILVSLLNTNTTSLHHTFAAVIVIQLLLEQMLFTVTDSVTFSCMEYLFFILCSVFYAFHSVSFCLQESFNKRVRVGMCVWKWNCSLCPQNTYSDCPSHYHIDWPLTLIICCHIKSCFIDKLDLDCVSLDVLTCDTCWLSTVDLSASMLHCNVDDSVRKVKVARTYMLSCDCLN